MWRKVTREWQPSLDSPRTAKAEDTGFASTLHVGERVGQFEIVEFVGNGAFGEVFHRDHELSRDVALKIQRTDVIHAAIKSKLMREARAAAAVRHANICTIYQFMQVHNRPCIVMAFIEGETLASLDSQRLDDREAAQLARKVAVGLAEAHRRGLVHRDLKPANIMLDQSGEPIIMDFGLALQANDQDARLTTAGAIIGTPSYMSPEQALGDSELIGPATDQYSLGVLLYEMLTGERPFKGTTTKVLVDIVHTLPQPPTSLQPMVHPTLEAICLRAMSRRRGSVFNHGRIRRGVGNLAR